MCERNCADPIYATVSKIITGAPEIFKSDFAYR